MTELEELEINDIREKGEFKGITFSQFKKTDVLIELTKALLDGKIEQSCYWSAELICAGHYLDLWDTIIHFFSKQIHIGNPKLVIYIDFRISQFKSILKNGFSDNELKLRNNMKIKKMFAEIIIILCYSKKKHAFSQVKLKKEELDTSFCQFKYKAPNLYFIKDFFLEEDSKDIFIPLNEFLFNIQSDVLNGLEACYWLEWLIEYEKKCKHLHIKHLIGRRNFPQVESKFQKDLVFAIWELLIKESAYRGELIKKMIECSFNLFCIQYNTACIKKRKYLLYFAIEILTETFSNNAIIEQKEMLEQIISNINIIYKQIKKNEFAPQTDYLFKNEKNNNLEKTIAKLETMKEFENSFIPRL